MIRGRSGRRNEVCVVCTGGKFYKRTRKENRTLGISSEGVKEIQNGTSEGTGTDIFSLRWIVVQKKSKDIKRGVVKCGSLCKTYMNERTIETDE